MVTQATLKFARSNHAPTADLVFLGCLKCLVEVLKTHRSASLGSRAILLRDGNAKPRINRNHLTLVRKRHPVHLWVKAMLDMQHRARLSQSASQRFSHRQ